MSKRRPVAGFTLIELLVVVAVIALLIAILLPSLARAKEQGRATVCLSNSRAIMLAFNLYEKDNGTIPGTYWQGPLNLDWAGRVNASYQANPTAYKHPLETSVLKKYVSEIDRILECPTGQREANTFFDYTVIIRMAGAKMDIPWRMTYPRDPLKPVESESYFPLLPLLIEEDAIWYNKPYDDGSWAGNDQFTERHFRTANVGYFDGSANRFRSPKGANPEIEEPGDLNASQLRLIANGKKFTVNASNAKEFGWANKPK